MATLEPPKDLAKASQSNVRRSPGNSLSHQRHGSSYSDSNEPSDSTAEFENSSARSSSHAHKDNREPVILVNSAKEAENGIENPMDRLIQRIKDLEAENKDLKGVERVENSQGGPLPLVPSTFMTFYYVEDSPYLEEPRWVSLDREVELRANRPIADETLYLEGHPEVAFAFHKDYDAEPPFGITKTASMDGVFKSPIPKTEYLALVSKTMQSAVENLAQLLPDFQKLFPRFDVRQSVSAPYLFMYYALSLLPEVTPKLSPRDRGLIELLRDSISKSHGGEYAEVDLKFKEGLVSRRLMKYLIQPGDVLVSCHGSRVTSFMASTWVMEFGENENFDTIGKEELWFENGSKKPISSVQPSTRMSLERNGEKRGILSWRLEGWHWAFDRALERTDVWLMFSSPLLQNVDEEDFKIKELGLYPVRFAEKEVRELLEKRGDTFWKCREQSFVSYKKQASNGLSSTEDRYMVDIETYRRLHQEAEFNRFKGEGRIKRKPTDQLDQPKGDEMLLFPPTIIGFNLRMKKWEDLVVDHICEVAWNKKAFESLVVDPETKELVQALVTNQLAAEKSTDLISGKGNGLIILLHGGPGTGKTFTAESVAEMAEKPLYRVTCGDVGTRAEDVEKYLESVLHLGKIWDCVVLLDEADIFLEERTLADLERNALVSVFLRVLEYYDGILILTSNRVGTFDEAFKSRIQLALHYENLTLSQRRKIWRNFLNRLKDLQEPRIDFDDIYDHIDDLAREEMNGRQIRNAITTARQLAQYKERGFCYAHLKHVIGVSDKFERYLKVVNEGYSDDQIKRGSGVR